MPTEVSSAGAGTQIQPGAQSALFSELNIVAALVANAFTAPSTTPTVDTVLWQYDAAGQVAQWLYVVSVGAWKGVEMS